MNNELPQIDFLSQPQEYIDPLHLDLNEDEIVRTVKENIRASVGFYQEKGLYAKQKRNRDYYLGKQQLYTASNKARPYKENVIYEGMSRQKPIALSRMPDVIVKPGGDDPEQKSSAEKLSGIFNSDIKKRENRKLYGLAFKQEPINYYAVVKARWNPEKGPFGDYEYINVHPDNIVWDQNCTNSNANDMRFVAEKAKMPLKEVIMMFPNKELEIKQEFGWGGNEDSDEKKLASQVNIWEVWFHWYKLKGSESEKIDGVIWIYGNLALKKMKNPYYDYQGKRKTFTRVMKEKESYSMDELFGLIDPESSEQEVVYNNYFQDPEKPYFFMVYENFGEHPISETSRIEQILEFQDSLNMDGSIIQDMNIRSRGKDLFDTNAIPQTTLDSLDMYNVDQAIGLDVQQGSSINNSHSRIEQKPATQQQYKSLDDGRNKAFEMIGTGPSARGLSQSGVTLGQEQMSREGDYGLIDDIVEDTINALAEWQGRWSMQFIKMFYTKPHMRHILGKDGEVLHSKLTQDVVDNGMEVVISASGVDKLQRKRMAMENAKLGMSDPLSFFEDTEQPQPKERAKRAMLFKMAPQMYMQEYVMDKLSPDQPQMPGMPTPPVPGQEQQAPQPPQPQMPQ